MKGQQILEEVRELLEDPGYSSFSEINRAYRRICRLTKFNWLRSSSETLLTFKADVKTYQLDMTQMRVLQRIWVKAVTGELEWKLLEEMPLQLFEENVASNRNSDGTDETTIPANYKLEGGSSALVTVTPTPDQTYDARVDYIAYLQAVTRDAEVPMPSSYLDAVAGLAAGNILLRNESADRQAYGQSLIGMAVGEFDGLVADSHPNRTKDIDRKEIRWMR